MAYDELSVFGRLRKIEKCGPYSMFTKLVRERGSVFSPIQVGTLDPLVFRVGWRAERVSQTAEKVKLFYFGYARNRHKLSCGT